MKVLLIGATGILGTAVHAALRDRGHEIVTAARGNADVSVDITDPEAVRAMYEKVGQVDAVANAAGEVPWKPFGELTHEDVLAGLTGKAVSQVELVRQGTKYGTEEASFTLITGVLARDPLVTGSMASLANGAVESFVRAAAIELPHRQRINVVSPTVFAEDKVVHDNVFVGHEAVPVRLAAAAYLRSIEGRQTGQVYVV